MEIFSFKNNKQYRIYIFELKLSEEKKAKKLD